MNKKRICRQCGNVKLCWLHYDIKKKIISYTAFNYDTDSTPLVFPEMFEAVFSAIAGACLEYREVEV